MSATDIDYAHREARHLTGPATVIAASLWLLYLTRQVKRARGETARAECDTSRWRVHETSSPAPLAWVPLVVLRSTTEREQIELNDLAQSLSAEGYQVVRRGPQWLVYTQITDRRKSVDRTIAARRPERRAAA
jgi:hypothetical protein